MVVTKGVLILSPLGDIGIMRLGSLNNQIIKRFNIQCFKNL